MGTMLVTFHSAGAPVGEMQMPVARLVGAKTEKVTTSGVSAKTTLTATNGTSGSNRDGGMATVTAVGVNLYVTSAADPTAAYPAAGANTSGFPVMSGQSVTFAVAKNEKVAGIEFT